MGDVITMNGFRRQLDILQRPLATDSSGRIEPMKPQTDYIRHVARLARKLQMDAAMGGAPQPDAEFYKALSKAMDEIAAGLELVAKAD
jgi:hypothetical protein